MTTTTTTTTCTETGFWDRVLYCPTETNSNTGGLQSALSVASATLGAQVLLFILVRTHYTRIYSPKSHAVCSNASDLDRDTY